MKQHTQKTSAPSDTKRPKLTLVSSVDDDAEKALESELVGFFHDFEDALRKEIEAILSL